MVRRCMLIFSVLWLSLLGYSQQTQVQSDPFASEEAVFVSTNGSDENPGTKVLPFKTIEVAIDKAVIFGIKTVKVGAGVYIPNNGLNVGISGVAVKHDGIKLIGGYNENFSAITGYSILDGKGQIQNIIEVKGVSNVEIRNFVAYGSTNKFKDQQIGSGVYINKSDNVKLVNVISSNNFSPNGAGIAVVGNNCTLERVISLNNYSQNNGGGMLIEGNSNKVVSSKVISNGSLLLGGGIFIKGLGNSIEGSEISYNRSKNGGGIFIQASFQNVILNSTVLGNSSELSGGGIHIDAGGQNQISSSISKNLSRDGGGIYISKSTRNVLDSTVSENESTRFGGGICLMTTLNTEVKGVVRGNKSKSSGGGIYSSGSDVILATVSDNISEEKGGGIYISGSKVKVSSVIQNNNAKGDGGGIVIEKSESVVVEKSTISGNTSQRIGGGLVSSSNKGLIISDSSVTGNKAKIYSGGVAVYDGNNIQLLNLDITGNQSEDTNIIVYLYKTDGVLGLVISNCTIGSIPNGRAFGIYEDGLNDTIQHYLFGNTFVESTLFRLYRDFRLEATGFISAVNNPKFSGASDAKDNKLK